MLKPHEMTKNQNIIRRVSPFISAGSAQLVNSGANFLFTVYLARILEKEEFGLYGLGFALLLMIQSIYAAIFSTQFVVNSASKPPFLSFMRWGHYAIVLTSSGLLVSLLLTGLAWLATSQGYDWAWVIPIAAAGALAFGLRDLSIRYAFIMGRSRLVLGSALVSAGMFLVVPISIHFYGLKMLSANKALSFYGMAQFLGFAYLVMFYKWRIYFKKKMLGVVLRESWSGGRWQVLTSILYSVRTQAHSYIVPLILDLRSLADINAARLLVSPALLLIPPVYQVVQPQLVQVRDHEPNAVISKLKTVVSITLLSLVVYSLFIARLYDPVVSFIYGNRYEGLSGLVTAWMFVAMFMVFRNGVTVFYEIDRRFKGLLFANVIVILPSLVVMSFLAWWAGSIGVIYGLLVSELILSVILLVWSNNKFCVNI